MQEITEAEWQAIQKELKSLRAQLDAALAQVPALQQQLAEAQERRVAGVPSPPPACMKANTPPRSPTVRKRRAPEHNRARRAEPPTQRVAHPITHCPDCHGRLSGVPVGRTR